MKVSEALLKYVEAEMKGLYNGQIVIEIVKTSPHISVVSRIHQDGPEAYTRRITPDMVDRIRRAVERVLYGKVYVTLDPEAPEDMSLVTEYRKRFENISK